jgi:hypothetical protein
MLLTRQELTELTGYKNPSAQKRWLQHEGFCFRVAADGRPRVLREAVIKELGGRSSEKRSTRRVEPQFENI